MINYSNYNRIKVSGAFFPLLPYNFEANFDIFDRVARTPAGFIDISETSSLWKTLVNPNNSDKITYQVKQYEKLQAKFYASEFANALTMKFGQNFKLVDASGQELLCKLITLTPEKQGNNSFYLYTIDFIVLEKDLVNIITPYQSDKCNSIEADNYKIELWHDNYVMSGYFTETDIAGIGKHVFKVYDPEAVGSIIVGDTCTITSFDKRNNEADGVLGTVTNITNGVFTIEHVFSTGEEFFPTSCTFVFSSVGQKIEISTIVIPKESFLKAENEKINVEGAVFYGNQSTFKTLQLLCFVSDAEKFSILENYENAEMILVKPDGKEITALFNPEIEFSENEAHVNCNPCIFTIPYTQILR